RVVMVDPACPIGGDVPQELVGFHGGEHRVGQVVADLPHRVVQVSGVDERAGALDEDQDLRVDAVFREPVEGVQQHRLGGRGVRAQVGRAFHHGGPGVAGDCGDAVMVGGDNHHVDEVGAAASVHCARHQRAAAYSGEVLQGDPLGSSSCGYDGDNAHR